MGLVDKQEATMTHPDLARRVAALHLTGRDPSQELKQTLERFRTVRNNMERDVEGGYRIDAGYNWSSLVLWGRQLAQIIIDTKEIPPRKAKGIELAARLFATGRKPRDIISWYEKNRKRLYLLEEAANWPERSEEGGIIQVGTFKVHNVVGASAKQVQRVTAIINKAIRALPKAKVPGFAQMAYGDLYLVGQIERKRWAAWYVPHKDAIYLRPSIRGMPEEDYTRHLIHELGHRYWRKKLDRSAKQAWVEHHERMVKKDADYSLPDVGEVLPFNVNKKPARVREYLSNHQAIIEELDGTEMGAVDVSVLSRWLEQAAETGKFPSRYASISPEEHFCEAIALRALGDLAPEHVEALDALWGSTSTPSVSVRLSSEVAVRHLEAMSHGASKALMKFLSEVSRRLGVGRHVYVVGGAVRNFVLNRPIKDIDVVIDSVALRGRDSAWFAKEIRKVIPAETSLVTNHYGVALLHIKGDWILDGHNLRGEDIEIANARKESYGGEGGKGYKPDTVDPATIHEDMARREFTFNTLLWRLHDLANGPDKAEILDLTGCGLRDLQEGILQCPSDPDKTFADDPSRIIRAVKFIVKYGFKIPPDVRASIQRNLGKIKNIPHSHLSNMLIGTFLRESYGKKALTIMESLGILDEVREIARSNKDFRNALSRWADREADLDFFFHLMDIGMPVGTRVSFLTDKQIKALREITVHMDAADSDHLVDVLAQPGKQVDTRDIIQTFGLKGKEIRQVTLIARDVLLERPQLASNPRALTQAVKAQIARKVPQGV